MENQIEHKIVCLDEIRQPHVVAELIVEQIEQAIKVVDVVVENKVEDVLPFDIEELNKMIHNEHQKVYYQKLKTDPDKFDKLTKLKHDLYLVRKEKLKADRAVRIANGEIFKTRGRPRKNKQIVCPHCNNEFANLKK